ncbi:MAG: PorV/PorQ family protein [candidate division KSB1 bacterium]|nr:PorV/PorQ family protein [candidate division KSB1 bacterium]MDZ7318684.1 PorV/PorQ family protein [candidate division KSB1 bacterium]MDZ7339951.1 PorV/PorQ family protein [candidate division KSB1 bacterium]
MKKAIFILGLAILTIGLVICNSYSANKKLAQTGLQFLSVATEARAAAMGEAFTTVEGRSLSLFHNPANLSLMNNFMDLSLNQNKWIADMTHYSASIAFNPTYGKYGTFGLSLISVDYGEFIGTRVDPTSDKGYIDTGEFKPSAFAIGLGYAKSLTDRFSVGGHIRYVNQKLGNSIIPIGETVAEGTKEVSNDLSVFAIDFGTIYRTGFKSLVFGMTVRNFSQEVKFESEGFQLPLTFKMGISMNIFDVLMEKTNMHSLLISVDAIHPRDYSEQLNFGAEYTLMNMLALRFGYMLNRDEQDFAAGFGVQTKFLGDRMIALDYAYTPFGVFDNVQRVSFRLSL